MSQRCCFMSHLYNFYYFCTYWIYIKKYDTNTIKQRILTSFWVLAHTKADWNTQHQTLQIPKVIERRLKKFIIIFPSEMCSRKIQTLPFLNQCQQTHLEISTQTITPGIHLSRSGDKIIVPSGNYLTASEVIEVQMVAVRYLVGFHSNPLVVSVMFSE